MKILRQNTEAAIALVLGLVEAISNPAFVVSPTLGFITANKSAQKMKSSGIDFSLENIADGKLIEFNGRTYRACGKEMNHRTDFMLFELLDTTTSVGRMQYAGQLLSRAIEGAHST